MELNYQGATLAPEVIQLILDKANTYLILPSLLITQLHVESMWGKSPVAIQNNIPLLYPVVCCPLSQ